MKRTVFVIVAVLLSAASGQWYETSIQTGCRVSAMCYNTHDNKLFCATREGGIGMLVIDGATNAILDTVPYAQPGYSMCYNPIENEVYCLTFDDSLYLPCILAVGGSTHAVLDTMWGGDTLESRLCLNHTSNKLYASFCGYAGGVFVFDCSTHERLSTIPDGWLSMVRLLCHNPDDNKAYANFTSGTGNGLWIIDGERDSTLCTIPWADDNWSGCHNARHGRVYLGRPYDVLVVDGAGDSLLRTIGVADGSKSLCFDSLDDKLYCGGGGTAVTAIDCSTDAVLRTIDVGGPVTALLYEPAYNNVYCASRGSNAVVVVDCSADSVLVNLGVGDQPSALCYNPQHNRVYVLNRNDSTISVLRCDPAAVEEEPLRSTPAQRGLFVRAVISLEDGASAELLDITGQRVMDLHPGANDVRALAPGVYFIRGQEPGDGGPGAAIQKVVVTR